MSTIFIERTVNLNGPIIPDTLTGVLNCGEADSHEFTISATLDNEPFALSGVVTANFIRSDGIAVPLTGSISDGAAVVVLSNLCYNVPGRFAFTVFITFEGVTTAIYGCTGTVRQTDSGSIVDPGEIIPSVSGLITAIENAIAEIPADYSQLLATQAPTFSPSTAYAAGSYVWYDGTLYRFTAAHAAGSWTGSDATVVTIGGEIADLKSNLESLTHIEYSKNLLNKSAMLGNKYLSPDGTIEDYNGRYVTDYIPVTAGKIVTSSYYNAATLEQTQSSYSAICCYNNQKSVVSGGNYNQRTFLVPTGVAYVRITYSSRMYIYNGMVELTDDGTPTAYVPYSQPTVTLDSSIAVAQSNVSGLTLKLAQVDSDIDANRKVIDAILETGITFTQNGFINYTGSFVSNENYLATDYINCISGGTFVPYKYRLRMFDNTKIAYYNENKQFISAISPSSSSTLEYVEGTVPYVDKAKYVRFCTAADSVGHYIKYASVKNQYVAEIPANPCDYSGNEISVFNKILCIGDSLTSGTFNYRVDDTTGNYVEYAKYSYPTYLKKLSGCDTANMGNGGMTSAEWYAAHANDDLSGYDCAIIQLGVNDCIRYTTWGQTSIGAFVSIINKLKTENKNIKIFVANIIPATSYSNSNYITFSDALLAWVTANYSSDQNVIPLDMQQYGHTKDSSAYNCGHLSALGYRRLAQDYKGYIGWYINQNKTVFKEVQFIGTDYYYDPIT